MKKNSPRQTGFSFLSDLPPEEFILRIPRQVKEYAAKKENSSIGKFCGKTEIKKFGSDSKGATMRDIGIVSS